MKYDDKLHIICDKSAVKPQLNKKNTVKKPEEKKTYHSLDAKLEVVICTVTRAVPITMFL
jgi:hypothetical protein